MALDLSKRFTYANVAATAALVLAIGGGGAATAAALVAKNSVGSPQIINGAVKTQDLHANAVRGTKVADGSLGGADLADGSVTGADVKNGSIKHEDLTKDPIGVAQGYSWNYNASPTLGVPTTLTGPYQYNSAGGPITLTRTAVGYYTVSFQGLDFFPGNVQVTAYGSTPNACKVSSWGSNVAYIRCFDAAGAAADSLFSLAVFK